MRIAVIGSGISGLVAARELAREHDVHVFEAGEHVGGHTHTHELQLDGRRVNVDSGFIVFNEKTYPGFCALLRELGVESRESDMGLSIRCERTGFEYNGRDLDTVFAQRSNVLSPTFHHMLLQILRFHREAPELLENGSELTVREWLDAKRYGRRFREHYLEPMAAAIWSAPLADVQAFPARFLARFLHNHGMLQVDGRPQWRTVVGGSRSYVAPLCAPFRDRIRLRTPVRTIVRSSLGVELVCASGERQHFDHVVIATHTDTALALLAAPTRAEREILGAIRYQVNEAVLHTDASLMPKRAKCWASWNCHLGDPAKRDASAPVAVTYWMNRLQGLELDTQVFVTLNASESIDPAKVLRRMTYDHPQFGLGSPAAQARRDELQGVQRTWYCGAYWGFGFHEDGLQSGLAVARAMAARLARERVVA